MATPDLDHLEHLGRVQDACAAAIPDVDPRTPVPWCGRWRVRALVVHLAGIDHWAAAQARGVREVPLGRAPFDPERLYRECAGELRATLAELGPDAAADPAGRPRRHGRRPAPCPPPRGHPTHARRLLDPGAGLA